MQKQHYLLLVTTVLLLFSRFTVCQSQAQTVSILGCQDVAQTKKVGGRLFVDVNDLARITAGSVTFKGDNVILVLPRCTEAAPETDSPTASAKGFSREFKVSAIEAMASIREWGGILQWIVQNGYVLKNTMTGSALEHLQEHAADKVALASVAASTDDDRQGLQLLRNEFDSIRTWSDAYIKARNEQNAASVTMSATAFDDDREAQKLVRCGHFLAEMFAGGAFQDHASCH